MKKTILIIVTLLFAFQAKAQVEVSANPIALLFEVGVFGIDYNINDDFGIGMDVAFGQGGGALYVNGKHYFRPRKGADRFLLGTFLGTVGSLDGDDGGAGLGFMFGYKWISRRNITFEWTGGIGRDFSGNGGLLPYGRFNVGYRFNRKIQKK